MTKRNEEWLRYVERGLASQLTRSEIVRAARRDLGCSRRQAYRLINYVYERMEKDADEERPMRRQQMVQSLRLIMQKALATEKLSEAIQAADRICKIYGLYDEKLRLEVQGKVELGLRPNLKKLTDEQLAQLEELHRLALATEVEELQPKQLPAVIDVEDVGDGDAD